MNPYLDISPEVKAALDEGKPVVALESTIISHGMPYPKNVETALRVEQTIRDNGAVPATIAVIGGRLKAGLSRGEIEHLGKAGRAVAKASRRDLPALVARGADGATTVTTTMIIAHMAGIRIFATGGIGGVHRGAETTMDISADLEELAQTPVMVVCAGAKSILDLGLTLEYLETKGVPVIGYGTDEHARHEPDPRAVRHGQGSHRRGDRSGPARVRGKGRARQGDHALPARARGRAHRRRESGEQHPARAEQRRARGPHGLRAVPFVTEKLRVVTARHAAAAGHAIMPLA